MTGRLRAGIFAAILFFAAGAAEAHSLRLFVDVVGTTISGYGFFVGGGRPQGVSVRLEDGTGREVAHLTTDEAGRFAWTAPAAGDYVVALDAGDGHFVERRIAAERFGPQAAAAPAAAVDTTAPSPAAGPSTPVGEVDPQALGVLVEASVERAMARRLAPLLEAQAAAEARVRFNDVAGGVGMIVGLVGLAAWGMARRRSDGSGSA